MARQVLNNLDTYGIQRGKINQNFSELYLNQLTPADVLIKTNTSPYTPTSPYHPSTKQYSDSIGDNLKGLYDPTGVNADAFERSNHHGQMEAQYVTEDTDNRFVSDSQIASWNAKEDSIGPKNTAFNKNFGTVADTVAVGNHTHTGAYEPANVNIQEHIATVSGNPHLVTLAEVGGEPANSNIQNHIAQVTGNPHQVTADDVGLGNVDNTSDADKPVSDDTLTAIANKLDNSVAVFIPQGSPAAGAGQVYYDQDKQALSVLSDVDMTLNIGQEQVIRVLNNSGATIPNAAVVRATTAVNKIPQIVLALADTQVNAAVVGIATHSIPNGTYGFITSFGSVDGNFSAFANSDRLYLSDTVPGGMTTVPPDIVTKLGGVLDNGTDGSIFVKIRNNMALPPVIGYMNNGTITGATIGAASVPVENYTVNGSLVSTVDPVNGTISTPTTGIYRVSATVNILHDDVGNNSGLASLELHEATGGLALSLAFNIARNQVGTNMTMAVPFSAIAGEVYDLELSSTETLTGVTINASSFDIKSEAIH